MRRFIAAFVAISASLGAAQAKEASFSIAPVNIADAPVQKWQRAERQDTQNAFGWRARFAGGSIWIYETHPGKGFKLPRFQFERRVLKSFEKRGFSNFRRVESTTSHGSQWGYAAIADRPGKVCVVDIDIISNGSMGRLLGTASDCAAGAVGRFDAWLT